VQHPHGHKPAQPIEKSTASASAKVIVAKVADHLPVSAELLEPLYQRMKAFVLSSKVVGTDDTPVKVLDRTLPHARKVRIPTHVDGGFRQNVNKDSEHVNRGFREKVN
jgi:hypothetical protein